MIRAPWTTGTSEEEARAYLQTRLTVLYKVMFWCFLALVVFLYVAYSLYPDIAPARQVWVWLAFASGLVIMAIVWRGLLLRKTLGFRALHAVDTFYTVATSSIIAFCAVASLEKRQAAFTCLLYTCFAVLTRALIVPSTGRRTVLVTAIAFIPTTISTLILARYANWPGPKDVSPLGFIVGYLQIAVVAIVLSGYGSQIIYGLRRQVSDAQQLGRYTLGRTIGEGGMGIVYLAHHVMLRRPTAVKLLHPDRVGRDNLQRFEREVQHMSQLTHPNTVSVYDYGHSDGVFYYAMEYLGGGLDLDKLVKMHGRQPAERVRLILAQVCGALQEAHDNGIVHRDIKPANIILCERGAMPDVVKVVDFGLVKEITADTGQSQAMILGTPAYVAPEAVTDPSSIGPAVDLYALGCVGYFLLTGRRVFDGKSALDLCIQHVTKAPQRPSEGGLVTVPPALEDLIMQCLAKQPSGRPASASALADALRAMGPFDDWDDVRATAWWREFRPSDKVGATSSPTLSVTVDLEHRIEART